jgi:hypothetical protein
MARAQTRLGGLDTSRSTFRVDSLNSRTTYAGLSGTGWDQNGATLSFDHSLSIYDWRGEFKFARPLGSQIAGTSSLNDRQWDSVYLSGTSRFLEANSITTTEAVGFVDADEPLGQGYPFKPFVMLFGSSYVTSGLPGAAAALLITRQADGFGIAGLRSQLPGTNIDVSLGGGLARQSQQASRTNRASASATESLSAYGTILRGDFSAPAEALTQATILQADALADERFYNVRGQRYSNDHILLRAASTLFSAENPQAPAMQPVAAGANIALLKLGLSRRDYFFGQDSASLSGSPAVKQERTEYSMSLVDSLTYPIIDQRLTGDASVEFEPRSVVRHSDAGAGLLNAESLSSLSSLLAPDEISSLRLSFTGRLVYEGKPILSGIMGAFGAEARVRYEENSENVRLLSAEVPGATPTYVSRLTSTLDQASFSARSTTAGFGIHYAPSTRDLFRLEGNARLLNYDTPSDLNDDDHDELVTSGILRYNRAFSNDLTGSLDLTLSRTHLVYLKSDRSAQNAVTQSISIAPEASVSTASILAHVRGEVFANYTVLDYLNSLPSLQAVGNYVLRGASLSDSILFSLGLRPFDGAGPITFEEGIAARLSERGNYDPGAFTERRDTRVTELAATALLGLVSAGSSSAWSLRAGVRGFVLSESGRGNAGSTVTASFGEIQRQTRIGPMLRASLFREAGLQPVLSGSLWYAVIKNESFDIPSVTRTPQLESHLQVQWSF